MADLDLGPPAKWPGLGSASFVLLILASCSATPQPSPVTFSGIMSMDTAHFRLAAGPHELRWTATPESEKCLLFITLVGPGGNLNIQPPISILPGDTLDFTKVDELDAGDYFFGVAAGCPWTISVA